MTPAISSVAIVIHSYLTGHDPEPIVTPQFEEIRDLLDGVVRVVDGRVGYWHPVGENADQKAKPLANDASAKQPTTVY